MLRKFAVGLAALGALNAAQVKALGLGEVTVHSALNQPLEAEIDLLQIRDLAASQIITGLADSDEFYLAGVKPTAVLSDIRFELDIREGSGKIFLTTREAIREPFLNFLVEVNWPSGRLVREYTVLLDPPVFSAKDLEPRSAPMPPASGERVSTPVLAPVSAPISMRPASVDSYRVGKDDTLWAIALNTRPDGSVSAHQMMLAIQRANPDAFINNNINRLKSGVVLRIPGASEIASLRGQDLVGEVKRQNVAWRGDAGSKPSPQGGQLDATAESSGSAAGAPESDASRLRIVSKPAQDEAEAEQAPGTLVADETQAEERGVDPLSEELLNKNLELEEQLVVTLEGLEKVERDNTELFQRLDQLSNQMASLQRLVELKDQQLAELQTSLSRNQAEAAPSPSVPESDGLLETVMKYPTYLAGGVVALLVLIGGLLFARKRKQKEDDQAVDAAMAELDARGEKDGSESANGSKVAAGAAAVAAVAVTAAHTREQQEALDEIAVEEDPNDPFNLGSDDAGDEFDSLTSDDLENSLGDDLDMDLKIDEPIDEDPEMAEFAQSLLSDDDYDLGTEGAVEEAEPQDMLDEEPLGSPEEEEGDDLDFLLSETSPETEAEPEVETEVEAEEDDDLDFILDTTREEEPSALSPEAEEDEESDLLGDLDDLLATDTAADESGLAELEPEAGQESGAEEEPELLGELDDLLGESAAEADSLEEEPVASAGEDDLVDSLDDFFDQPETESLVDEATSAEEIPGDQLDEPHNELKIEEDGDDIDALLAESEADLVDTQQEAPAAEETPAAEEEVGDDLDMLLAGLDDEDLEPAVEAKEEPAAAAEVADDLDVFEGLDLELEDEMGEAASAGQTAADGDVAEAAAEDELDLAGDEALEAELSQMLEKEGNGLSLEETALGEGGDETDYLEGADEVGTKLDLARAYIDMDDSDGARDILNEVLSEGTEAQKTEAKQLLTSLQ